MKIVIDMKSELIVRNNSFESSEESDIQSIGKSDCNQKICCTEVDFSKVQQT